LRRAAPGIRAILLALVLALPPLLLPQSAALARTESSAHQQSELIDAAVAHMAPRVSGASNVFFLGLAGYGEQRVFRKEAELARSVFGARFGAANRALLLVNDVHDRRTYPLATQANLRYALAAIARRMNRDEDVLLLVLTSHGSPQYGIALTNGTLVDDDLGPRALRQALDATGIRWRMVIASACYAGIFIHPLATPSTLVMTAADSHHSSFGCADDRDLTYFGEALVHDSLPGACSLEDAFERARRIIRSRETQEGEIHSNPQLYVGAAMHAKLRTLSSAQAQSCSAAAPTGPSGTRGEAR
jgi:hypothetical protein